MSIRYVISIAGALLVSAGAPAQAKDQAVEACYSREFDTCMNTGDAGQGITSGMMDCIGDEIDRQDARFNQAYKMVMMRLAPAQKTTLRAAERAWITQRDARCHRESADEEGGTLANLIYANCILDATISRTIWLERFPSH